MCNRGHDREAEPCTGCRSVGSAEPLEGEFAELRRKPPALIGDVHHQPAGNLGCFESQRAAAGLLDNPSGRAHRPACGVEIA